MGINDIVDEMPVYQGMIRKIISPTKVRLSIGDSTEPTQSIPLQGGITVDDLNLRYDSHGKPAHPVEIVGFENELPKEVYDGISGYPLYFEDKYLELQQRQLDTLD